jgi:hypothetical protein
MENTDNSYTAEWFRATLNQRKQHRAWLATYRRQISRKAADLVEVRKSYAALPLPILHHGNMYLTMEDMAKFVRRFTGYRYNERSLRRFVMRGLTSECLQFLFNDPAKKRWEARMPWHGPKGFRIVCPTAILKQDLLRFAVDTQVVMPRTYKNPLVTFLDSIELNPTTSRRKLTCALNLNEYRLERIAHYLIQAGIIKLICKSVFGRTYKLIQRPSNEELDEMVFRVGSDRLIRSNGSGQTITNLSK